MSRRFCETWEFASICDRDDFRADFISLDPQASHSDGQFEPPRAGAARIEVQNAGAHLLPGNVAVAVDDDSESGSLRLQIELRKIVENID